MALYLGSSERLKVISDNVVYRFNLFSETSITNGFRLLSSDSYILKDLNGLYLIPKDAISSTTNNIVLLSSDSYILKDLNGLYLISKEDE